MSDDGENTQLHHPDSDVTVGTVLQQRYRLLERLGAGGMGEAWKASDSRRLVDGHHAQVVIKLLPKELRLNEEANEDIRREYSRVWLLSHPHICKLFDMGEQDGIGCFQVMQYLPGMTLRQWLRRQPEGLTAEQVLPILRAAASALDYAHSIRRPVVHRDVKPENIMYDSQTGDVHVIDFGLAAEIRNSQTRYSNASETLIAGTASYMSPEQWQGRPASAACDQWALGIIAWELLTGSRPFQGNGIALGFAVCQAGLPQLPAVLGHLQDIFERVLKKTLPHLLRLCQPARSLPRSQKRRKSC
jgi:serine/threonine-protein kinase